MSNSKIISKEDFRTVALIISAGFVAILNQTLLSPALPSIMEEYSVTASAVQWLTTIFLLVNGIMIPITAYLIERFTTRTLFISSMSIFALGTVIAGIAPTFELLLLARVLQAAGAGVQMPLGAVVMMRIFPKEKRGYAMGLVGVVVAFAPAIGPTMSGLVVDTIGWQFVFLMLVPFVLVVILCGIIFLHNVGEIKTISLDWLSVVLSTIAFGGILYGFSAAGTYGWISALTIAPLAIGAVTFYIYVKRQLSLEEPLLNLRLMSIDKFSASVVIVMILNGFLIAGVVIFPIYMQNVLGYSALYSGLLMLPSALATVVMNLVAGIWFDKYGPRKLIIVGLAIFTITTLRFCFLTDQNTFTELCIIFTIRGIGMSMVNMPANTWGYNALDNEDLSHGNAINNTGRQVAGSMGTAIMITIMSLLTMSSAGTLGPVERTMLGINGAFVFATILAAISLVIAIVKVKN